MKTQIQVLTTRILQKASRANCEPANCRILVTDFTLPSGSTSQLGMQLADQFSKELASQQSAIQVIERPLLRSYLEQERIPATFLKNEKAARWLGKQLTAMAVLTGSTESKDSSLRLKVRLLSCENEKSSAEEEMTFSYPEPGTDLSPTEPFATTLPTEDSSLVPMVYRAGVGGVTSPACLYCPQPDDTSSGRDAKFIGTVLLDAVVSAEGRVVQVRIVRGVPYGLNEAAINSVRRWRFKPSTFERKPVTAWVKVEITFHFD